MPMIVFAATHSDMVSGVNIDLFDIKNTFVEKTIHDTIEYMHFILKHSKCITSGCPCKADDQDGQT